MASFPGQKSSGPSLPVITSPSILPNAEVSANYSFQFTGAGGRPPYTFTPPSIGNFTLSPQGLLFNTAPLTAGSTFNFSVTITDSAVPTPNSTTSGFQLTTLTAPVITPTSPLPGATAGVFYSTTLSASGGTPPYSWAATSGLPSWATLDPVAGTLSGTPTGGEVDSIVIQVTDSYVPAVPSAPVTFSLTVAGAAGVDPPQAMWLGAMDSQYVKFQIWPPASGVDSFNIYRTDVSTTTPIATGILLQLFNPTGPPAARGSVPQAFYEDFAGNPQTPSFLPNTTYSYFARTMKGGVLSAPGPTLTITTLAAGPGSTPPTPPTDPATYFPPTNYLPATGAGAGTLWLATITSGEGQAGIAGTANAYNGKLSVNCGLQYATQQAIAGDLIIYTANATYISSIGTNGAYWLPNVNGPAWTVITSSEDPLFKSGGKLIPLQPAQEVDYAGFSITAPVAIGALSATLTAPWAGRTAYFPAVFYTNAPPGFESRDVHLVNGSTAVTWNAGVSPTGIALSTFTAGSGYTAGTYAGVALTGGTGTGAQATISVNTGGAVVSAAPTTVGSGYVVGDVLTATFGGTGTGFTLTVKSLGGGALIGSGTNSLILVHQGTYVTPDDAAVVGSMANIQFNTNVGRGLYGQPQTSFIRVVGAAIVPAPGPALPTNTTSTSCVDLTAYPANNFTAMMHDIMLDRCVLGNDSTSPGFAQVFRGVQAIGNNIVAHQCWMYGFSSGQRGGDTQAFFSQGGGPHLVQNCHLEATAETLFGGGGVYTPQQQIPHDGTYRYNYLHKNGAWNGLAIAHECKNQWEVKCHQRYAIYGNILQNCWWSQGGAGQNGRAFMNGAIDQSAATGSRSLGAVIPGATATWSAGAVTAFANFMAVPQGQTFQAVITGVTPAGYNGTFVATSQGFTNNGLTFTYPLPTNPGSNGTGGAIAVVAQALNPWNIVSDGNVYNNLCVGVGSAFEAHTEAGILNASGRCMRVRCANNVFMLDPSCTDNFNTLSEARGIHATPHTPDVIYDHNTIIAIAQNTGYLQPGAGIFTAGADLYSSTNTGVVPYGWFDRMTITNNILDGTHGFTVESINGNSFQGSGPSAITTVMLNPVFSNNLMILDATTGYPTPNYNPVAYSAVGFTNFLGNNQVPQHVGDWNVTGATPYATGSTTGGPVGATLGAPQITTLSLPNATVGTAYSVAMSAIGGTPPYTWSFTSALPNWNNQFIITAAGVIVSNPLPQQVEPDVLMIQVQDSLGATAVTTLTLTVVHQ